jgi:hypothetical protein
MTRVSSGSGWPEPVSCSAIAGTTNSSMAMITPSATSTSSAG